MLRNSIVWIPLVVSLIGPAGCSPSPPPMGQAKFKELVSHYDDGFKVRLADANTKIGKDIVRYEPIASNVIPRKTTIQGTHREIGRWVGLVAKGWYGEKYYETVRDRLRRKPEAEGINREIVAMYESIFPRYLDLVGGLAEAFDLTVDEVDLRYVEHNFLVDLWVGLLQYERFYDGASFSAMGGDAPSKCSLVSIYEADKKRHSIGRNFDGGSDRPHFVVNTEVEGVYKTLGSACYFPYHWMVDGINEKGLFIGVATNEAPRAYNKKEPEYPDEPAVQVIHMVRIALETCTTVDEAIARFQSVRIWFPAEVNHLLIADESGSTAVVEWDLSREMVAFRRTEPRTILTNAAYQKGIKYIRDRCWRYRKGQATMKSMGQLGGMETVHEVAKVIRQMHKPSRTLWTSYFDLSARRMDIRLRTEGFRVPYTFVLE